MLAAALAAVALLAVGEGYHGSDLPPGPYCGERGRGRQCCVGRVDDCSHEILGTICYCDNFCMRNNTKHDDCCPDYEEVCLGILPPAPLKIKSCQHAGRNYIVRSTRKENCNECECVETSDIQNPTRWECSTNPCLISENVISNVNQRPLGWRAANYSQFWGRKLSDGIKYKLGTLPLSPSVLSMKPDPSYTEEVREPSFDARNRWPRYITPVYDQGWCGSDWAVSTAAVASDRFAILSNGAEAVQLSAQQLVSCDVRRQRGCEGGHVDRAWIYSKNVGLVDEECFPYSPAGAARKCPRARGGLLEAGCRARGRTDRYRTSPPKRLGSETDIMYEIMSSGPVQALMTVHHDFFHYRDGIYRHTTSGDQLKGLHSVRIIGWGEDRGDKYWLVANSWGEQWGENGYFRIARGENESGIERFVIAPLVQVLKANEVFRRK